MTPPSIPGSFVFYNYLAGLLALLQSEAFPFLTVA